MVQTNACYSNDRFDLQLTRADLNEIPYSDAVVTRVINTLKSRSFSPISEDTLGVMFEKMIRESEKKDLGQFYTPQEIVNYIVDFLNITADSKILDPTCGCGVFLVTAYNHLKRINSNALNNIYGVDLNNSATKIARINLWLRNGQDSYSLNVLENNIKTGNSIVGNRFIDKKAFN